MKVLLVAMCDSVHTAGWVRQFSGHDVNFVLFPSTPHRRLHFGLRALMGNGSNRTVSMRRSDRLLAAPLGLLDMALRSRLRSHRLRRLLQSQHFDFVHLLETQHAGYMFTHAVRGRAISTPVALSIWGSDLFWFEQFESHQRRLRDTLAVVNHIFVECERDIAIARRLGFSGSFAPPMPASGGMIDVSDDQATERAIDPPSTRRVVVVKGYTGFVGRADTALRVVVKMKEEFRDFTVHFYSVGYIMHWRIWWIGRREGLRIVSHRKKTLTHSEMIGLFRSARVSIALSASDGLPGSMREAALTGAFPIESCGSCVSEWTRAGEGALIVDPSDEHAVIAAVSRALSDDSLVDRAIAVNRSLVQRTSHGDTVVRALSEYMRLAEAPADSL